MSSTTKQLPRGFKGVWVPRSLYLDKRFNWTEKILLCEIDSLDADERGCFASDEYLAEFLDVAPGTISNLLTKLRAMDAIAYVRFDGKNRGMRSLIHDPEPISEDPSRGFVIVETERALGFALPLMIRERVEAVVKDKFVPNWCELIRNRLATMTGRGESFIQNRVGYWLDDYQKQERFWENEIARTRSGARETPRPSSEPVGARCDDCRDTDGLVSGRSGMRRCAHPGLKAAA